VKGPAGRAGQAAMRAAVPSPRRGEGGARGEPASGKVRKNTLDEMTIRRTEVPAGGKSRPHKPSLDEMHGIEEVPLADGERPKPRSTAGRPGTHAGKGGGTSPGYSPRFPATFFRYMICDVYALIRQS
jgi:hypothetical protein